MEAQTAGAEKKKRQYVAPKTSRKNANREKWEILTTFYRETRNGRGFTAFDFRRDYFKNFGSRAFCSRLDKLREEKVFRIEVEEGKRPVYFPAENILDVMTDLSKLWGFSMPPTGTPLFNNPTPEPEVAAMVEGPTPKTGGEMLESPPPEPKQPSFPSEAYVKCHVCDGGHTKIISESGAPGDYNKMFASGCLWAAIVQCAANERHIFVVALGLDDGRLTLKSFSLGEVA